MISKELKQMKCLRISEEVRQPPFGWDDLSFLQERLLLQQVCHAAQTDAKGGKVMQHRTGSRGQDAQCAQKDEHWVEAEHKAVIAAHPLLQGVGNGF